MVEADPDAPARVADRFGGPQKTYVESDGTGAKLLPYGTLVVHVIDKTGRPTHGQTIKVDSRVPAICCESFLNTNGSTEYRGAIPATSYTVSVEDDLSRRIVAAKDVVIEPGAVTEVTLVVGSR